MGSSARFLPQVPSFCRSIRALAIVAAVSLYASTALAQEPHPLHDIPLEERGIFNALIEISRGSFIKYELDHHTGRIVVDRILRSADPYPADYGLFPRTLYGDGDPLDVVILGEGQSKPGQVVRVRPIAIMQMVDTGEVDDKVIAVREDDPRMRNVRELRDLPPETLQKVQTFFETYKIREGKSVQVNGFFGAREAASAIARGAAEYLKGSPNPAGPFTSIRDWSATVPEVGPADLVRGLEAYLLKLPGVENVQIVTGPDGKPHFEVLARPGAELALLESQLPGVLARSGASVRTLPTFYPPANSPVVPETTEALGRRPDYAEFNRQVNPNGNIQRVYYPMGGSDVRAAFEIFGGPKEILIADRLPFGSPSEVADHFLNPSLKSSYFDNRRTGDYSRQNHLEGVQKTVGQGILWELETLGAKNVRVQYLDERGRPIAAPGDLRGRYEVTDVRSFSAETPVVEQRVPYYQSDAASARDPLAQWSRTIEHSKPYYWPPMRDVVAVDFEVNGQPRRLLYVQQDVLDAAGTPRVFREFVESGYDALLSKASWGAGRNAKFQAALLPTLKHLNPDHGVIVSDVRDFSEAAYNRELPLRVVREVPVQLGYSDQLRDNRFANNPPTPVLAVDQQLLQSFLQGQGPETRTSEVSRSLESWPDAALGSELKRFSVSNVRKMPRAERIERLAQQYVSLHQEAPAVPPVPRWNKLLDRLTGRQGNPSTQGSARGLSLVGQQPGPAPPTSPGRLLLLRHGQSEANRIGWLSGSTDVPLSPEGEAQARQAGRVLAETGLRADRLSVYTSELSRAVDSAEIALESAGLRGARVVRNAALNERSFGALEGMTLGEARELFGREQIRQWRRSYDGAPPAGKGGAGESVRDVELRAMPYFRKSIVPELEAGRDVLVVAHEGTLLALVKNLEGLTPEQAVARQIGNAKLLAYQNAPDGQGNLRFLPLVSRPAEARNPNVQGMPLAAAAQSPGALQTASRHAIRQAKSFGMGFSTFGGGFLVAEGLHTIEDSIRAGRPVLDRWSQMANLPFALDFTKNFAVFSAAAAVTHQALRGTAAALQATGLGALRPVAWALSRGPVGAGAGLAAGMAAVEWLVTGKPPDPAHLAVTTASFMLTNFFTRRLLTLVLGQVAKRAFLGAAGPVGWAILAVDLGLTLYFGKSTEELIWQGIRSLGGLFGRKGKGSDPSEDPAPERGLATGAARASITMELQRVADAIERAR